MSESESAALPFFPFLVVASLIGVRMLYVKLFLVERLRFVPDIFSAASPSKELWVGIRRLFPIWLFERGPDLLAGMLPNELVD